MFWRLDNKKAVLFPRVCVRLRYVFTKKEKNFFCKNRAVHAMPPGGTKSYNDHIKRNLKNVKLVILQPYAWLKL